MSVSGTLSARQWAQLMGLGLLLAVTVIVVVAVVLPTAALVTALVLAVAGVAMVAQRVGAVARAATQAVAGKPGARQATTGEPEADTQPTLRIELASGEVRAARPVAMPQSEHSLLLTRDGYLVVSAEGRVLHRI